MAYLWYSFSKPNITTAEATSGGTCTASTTFYIKIAACSVGVTTSIYESGAGTRFSEASNEVSIVTDSTNKSLHLVWDAVSGANSYLVHITKIAPGTANRWVKTYYSSDGNKPTTSAIDLTIDTETYMGKNDIHTLAYDQTYPFPGNLDRNLGEARLNFYDAVGTITLKDIYDIIVANDSRYAYYDGSTFVSKVHIYFLGTATGSLTINGINLIHIRTAFNNPGPIFSMTLDTCNCIPLGNYGSFSYGKFTSTGCCFKGGVSPNTGVILQGNMFTAAVRLPFYNTWTDGGYNFFTGTGNSLYFWSAGMTVEKNMINGMMDCPVAGAIIKNNIIKSEIYKESGSTSNSWEIRENDFRGLIARDFRTEGRVSGIAEPVRFYDNTTIRSDNMPVPYNSTADVTIKQNVFEYYFSILFKVTDIKNNVIPGARIIIVDKNGTQIFNDITAADGLKSSGDLLVMSKTQATGSWIETYKTPFFISISKSGYETFKTNFSFNKKLNWSIVLKNRNEA